MVSRHCQIAVNHSLMWNMISLLSDKTQIAHKSMTRTLNLWCSSLYFCFTSPPGQKGRVRVMLRSLRKV